MPCGAADQIRLELDNIGKTYGRRRVLHNIYAELQTKDSLVVMGSNGIGKSTLLKIIAGLLRPSQGTVRFWVGGVSVGRDHRRDLIGFVGPDVYLYRELTAREHVLFIAQLRGLPVDDAQAAKILARIGLAGREDESVGSFSSGMLQRLRYALALIHRPAILLLDEPTTNLDAAGIALVDDIVAETAQRGIVIVATNDPREMRYGDMVLSLDGSTHG